MFPIIDTHQHLWDLGKFRLAWTDTAPTLAHTFLTPDYLSATNGLNVVKAIYMEVDVDPSQQVAEAEMIIDLCQRDDNPTVAAVISGRPADADGFRAYISHFQHSPYIKGVRQVLHGASTPPGYCLQPSFVKSVQWLGELGLRYDLCLRPAELGDAVTLVDQCPGTQFILDHCGNADFYTVADASGSTTPERDDLMWHTRQQWLDDIRALAERPNVVCKISGIVQRARPTDWTATDLAPTINHCLDSFGPDRVVFGGDWPVCTLGAPYAAWVNALKMVIRNRSEEEQRKLLAENAARIYGV
jgi:predicted TIM-barrel fold metal-dependent hydrolase